MGSWLRRGKGVRFLISDLLYILQEHRTAPIEKAHVRAVCCRVLSGRARYTGRQYPCDDWKSNRRPQSKTRIGQELPKPLDRPQRSRDVRCNEQDMLIASPFAVVSAQNFLYSQLTKLAQSSLQP